MWQFKGDPVLLPPTRITFLIRDAKVEVQTGVTFHGSCAQGRGHGVTSLLFMWWLDSSDMTGWLHSSRVAWHEAGPFLMQQQKAMTATFF